MEIIVFYLCSLYGVVKLYVYWMIVNYCELYGLFGSSGILFNYELLLCGCEFVMCKIMDIVVKIWFGKVIKFEFGNFDVKCDWGFVFEYVEGMWCMLQVDEFDIYVFVINCIEIVCDFVWMVFVVVGYQIEWIGKGEQECGFDVLIGNVFVEVNLKFYCLVEVDLLIGCVDKVKSKLGWVFKMMFE